MHYLCIPKKVGIMLCVIIFCCAAQVPSSQKTQKVNSDLRTIWNNGHLFHPTRSQSLSVISAVSREVGKRIKMPADILSVPIVNVSSLFSTDGGGEGRQKTIKEIGDACRDWGFFYVVGHNVKPEFVQEFKTQSFEFFRKPKDFKRSILRKPDNLRGYFDQELTKQKLDWKEVFDYGAEVTKADLGLEVDGGNLWPEGMPEFKRTLIDFYQAMYDLSQELVLAMFASLKVDPKDLQQETKGSYETSVFRLNLYPPCPDPNKHLGVGPHTDSGSLTVLLQDDKVASLQVERDGKFYDIPPVPG